MRAFALGLVPGVAHIFVLERTGWGTLFFVAFVLGADGALAGLYLLDERWAGGAYTAGCVLAGAAWLLSWLDMARLVVLRDYEKRAALRAKLAAEGVKLYAGGHLLKARNSFRQCLDLDHRDPDVLFWYGCVEAGLGQVRRAHRSFRRCRKYDLQRKWSFEVGRQEERLAEAAVREAGQKTGG